MAVFEPALGTLTSLPAGSTLRFRAGSSYTTPYPQVWTNACGGSWKAISFARISDDLWEAKVELQQDGKFEFTYRMVHADGGIEWLGKAGNNGSVVVNSEDEGLDALFPGLEASITTVPTKEADVSAHLFSFPITASGPIQIPAPSSTTSGVVYERTKPTWYEPRHISSIIHLSMVRDVQFLLLQRPHHPRKAVVALYPISTSEVVTVLRANGKGGLYMQAEREAITANTKVQAHLAVVTGPAWATSEIMASAVSVARTLSIAATPTGREQLSPPQAFRFCTWNSLGSHFTLSKTLGALGSFEDAKFAHVIDSVLLDDGWQDIGPRPGGGFGLQGFGAKEGWNDVPHEGTANSNPSPKRQDSGYGSPSSAPKEMDALSERGIQDLRRAVQAIKAHGHSNIRRVGVWLTLAGYWGAINPSSPLGERYNVRRWAIRDAFNPQRNSDAWYLPALDCVEAFWDDFFFALRGAGVDFAKVDNQASIDYISHCESHPHEKAGPLREALHKYMHAATQKHFGSEIEASTGVINCMSHSPRTWGGAAVSLPAAALMRTSDDFFPNQNDSHRWHVIVNAYNSLLAKPLGFHPDLDMLMTRHQFSSYHASLRIFSPSPIYVTDKPGEHDISTVDLLSAPLKMGGDGIVKTRGEVGTLLAGRVFDRAVLQTERLGLLKMGVPVPGAHGAVLGLWHTKQGQGKAYDVITLRDLADAFGSRADARQIGLDASAVVVVLRNSKKTVVVEDFKAVNEKLVANAASPTVVGLTLEEAGWDTATIAPLIALPATKGFRIAAIGLLEKASGLSAISNVGLMTAISPRPQQPLSVPVQQRLRAASASSSDTTATAVSTGSNWSNNSALQARYGRITFALSYIHGNRDWQGEPVSALASLRQDLWRQPVTTIVDETKGIIRLATALVFIAFASIWARVWRTGQIGAVASNGQQPPKDAPMEKTGLFPASPPSYHEPLPAAALAQSPTPARSPSPAPPRSVLRVETPFTGKLGFLIVPPPDQARPLELGGVQVAVNGAPSEAGVSLEESDGTYRLVFDLAEATQALPADDAVNWTVEVGLRTAA